MTSTPDSRALAHLRFGWIMLTIFMVIGVILETLHGLKVPFYLDAANETRHLMWRLGHAHGALFGIINLLYGFTLSTPFGRPRPVISRMLIAGGALLPLGFLGGGAIIHRGDPGVLVLLVPVGAALAIIAAARTALDLIQTPSAIVSDDQN